MKLKQTIRSTVKPAVIYGEQGDEVKIIRQIENIAIVEGKDGNRFTVMMEVLSNDPVPLVEKEGPIQAKKIHKPPPAARKQKVKIKTNTLFNE